MVPTATWVADLRVIVSEIETLAKTFDEKFQVACFEILLSHSLENGRVALGEDIIRNGDATSNSVEGSTLKKLGVTREELARLIDLDSGEILITKLGKTKRERQRMIALLISAHHYATHGKFSIPKAELIEKCKHFDAYDPTNFSKPMKGTSAGGIRVFVPENGDWKVSGPGETVVAETVKELISGNGH